MHVQQVELTRQQRRVIVWVDCDLALVAGQRVTSIDSTTWRVTHVNEARIPQDGRLASVRAGT